MLTWLYIGLAILVDGAAGLAGGLLSDRSLGRLESELIGFAAGALITAVFLDVLPEAGTAALPWALGGFLAIALLEWSLGHQHGHHRDQPRALPAALLFSDALHNIGDGAAVAAAFIASPNVGLTVAIAVIAHEVPQEVGDFALLRASGMSRGRALLALAGVQLTAALGALGVLVYQHVAAAVLGIAGGTFLYIGATDLLPEIQHAATPTQRRRRMAGFLLGVAALVIVTLVAH